MNELDNAQVICQWSLMPGAEIEAFGDAGDWARQYLLTPTILACAGAVAGRDVLDAGCGQGYLARLLARRGARVVGVEPAEPLIQYAREREQIEPLGISYLQADLSTFQEPQLQFDLVVASMVLMDIPDDRAALAACVAHLRPGGELIIAISHPCFEDSDSAYAAQGAILVREYFAEYAIPQRYGWRIHRPLSHYFDLVLQHGLLICRVAEPQLHGADRELVPNDARIRHVPSFLAIHAQKPSVAS